MPQGKIFESQCPAADEAILQVCRIKNQRIEKCQEQCFFCGFLLANFNNKRKFKSFPDMFVATSLLVLDRWLSR